MEPRHRSAWCRSWLVPRIRALIPRRGAAAHITPSRASGRASTGSIRATGSGGRTTGGTGAARSRRRGSEVALIRAVERRLQLPAARPEALYVRDELEDVLLRKLALIDRHSVFIALRQPLARLQNRFAQIGVVGDSG